MDEKIENQKNGKIIEITAEIPISLEELSFVVLQDDSKGSEIIEILDKNPERAEKVLLEFSELDVVDEADVEINGLKFSFYDSDNLSHGVAYFKIKLEGTEEELRKIAGNNNEPYFYDWSDAESLQD